MTGLPESNNAGDTGHDRSRADLSDRLANALPSFLPAQRWFGDKSRTITSVIVVDQFDLGGSARATLAIVDVNFTEGPSALYAVPVAVAAESPRNGEPISEYVDDQGSRRFLIDGLANDSVRAHLLDLAKVGSTKRGLFGQLTIDRLNDPKERLARADGSLGRLLNVDQSNSACVFGEEVLIKVFRRLAPGINPDVELTRFLTGKGAFEGVPAYLASLTYADSTGESYVLAVAQAFVNSTADGWNHVLADLRARLEDGDGGRLITDARVVGAKLGDVTARMHLALCSDPWTPDLAPEAIRQLDVDRWQADFLSMLDRVTGQLRALTDSAGGNTRELVDAFLEVAPGLRTRAAGFQRLLGRSKTRVHGDFHLGQTLRTEDGNFVLLDFEGEPARPITERRLKTSPLKDVAGMVRSFSYARGTAFRWLDEQSPLLPSDLVTWERSIRAAYLGAYVETARSGGASFVPVSTADFEAALGAWELDKATYEVLYELNNRPDWLWIPLSAMLKYGEPSPTEI